MSYTYSETIYSNDIFDIIKRDGAIIVKFKVDNNLIISSWLNGGYQENIYYVVNQSLEEEDYDEIATMDYADFQKICMNKLNLNPNLSTGLITSACMDNYAISFKSYKDLKVTSIVTAGADKNGIRAGDPSSFYEHNHDYLPIPGTINIITIIDANLEPGALITASITATEAKTSILEDLKLESQFSTKIATGTGTDGICIVSNKSSSNHIENAGKHSKLGELIAKSVQEATKKALYLQTAMSSDYQKTVLSRLTRFNVTFDTFYEKSNKYDKLDYATKLFPFINDTYNIAWISSVVNLIDEVQDNLLDLIDIVEPVQKIVESFIGVRFTVNPKSTDDIINYLIDSINIYLEKEKER